MEQLRRRAVGGIGTAERLDALEALSRLKRRGARVTERTKERRRSGFNLDEAPKATPARVAFVAHGRDGDPLFDLDGVCVERE